jgi:plastocyanin
MAPPRRGEGRRRHGRRLLLFVFLTLGAFQTSAVGVADEPTVEPAETASGYAWKPSSVTAAAGGSVAFRNPGNTVPHGVHWTGGPEKPACSGVPVDSFGTAWSGACTFAQAGTYTFVCTVHPEEMRGTVSVSSGETTPVPAPSGPGQAPPVAPEGPAAEALRLPRRQHGAAVRGSISISPAAVGGRLVAELSAKRLSLGGRGQGIVRVGKLTRSLAGAGRLSFAVALTPPARRALQRRGRLFTTVKLVVTEPAGPGTTMTKGVELHE